MGGGNSRGDSGMSPGARDGMMERYVLPPRQPSRLDNATDDHDEGYRLKALGSPRKELGLSTYTGAIEGGPRPSQRGNPGVSACGEGHQTGQIPLPHNDKIAFLAGNDAPATPVDHFWACSLPSTKSSSSTRVWPRGSHTSPSPSRTGAKPP